MSGCQPDPAVLEETVFLDQFQSGFRAWLDTEAALVSVYDYLCQVISAAFDTIGHGTILGETGVGGPALKWFHSYLDQKVVHRE